MGAVFHLFSYLLFSAVPTHRDGWAKPASCENLAAGYDVDLKFWIGGGDVRRRESEFAAHDIATLGQGTRLVKSDLTIAALTSEAAVVGDNQLFRRNIFQRFADFRRH